MADVELGLYHYKLIYSILSLIEKSKNLNTLIPVCFNEINNFLKSDLSIYFKMEKGKITPLIIKGIDEEKLKSISNWEVDGIISKVIEYNIPLKSDLVLEDKIFKDTNIILFGLGYTFESLISMPVSYDNKIYAVILFANKTRKFTPHEFETLKLILNQISYHLHINKLTEESDMKCKYFATVLDNMSSGIIIYSENEVKFINKKAIQITEGDGIKNNLFLNLIKKILAEKKSVSRMEEKINFNGKEKVIGYSGSLLKIDRQETVVFIFQDITKFISKTNQNSA